MVIAHRALRDQFFRDTVVCPTDAATLFDAGAGQVSIIAGPCIFMILINAWELGPRRKTIPRRPMHSDLPRAVSLQAEGKDRILCDL